MLVDLVSDAETLDDTVREADTLGRTQATSTTEPLTPEASGVAIEFCAIFGPAPTKAVAPSHATPGREKLRKDEPPPPPLP